MTGNDKLCLTAKEAADCMGVGVNTVYVLAHRADFPCIRVGKKIIIHRQRFEEWLYQQAGAGDALNG